MKEKFIALKLAFGGGVALVQVQHIQYIVPSTGGNGSCVLYFGKEHGFEVIDTQEEILKMISEA